MTLHLECYVVVSSWNTGMAVSRNAGCLSDLASTCACSDVSSERASRFVTSSILVVRAVGVIHARGRIGGLSCQSTVHGRAS